LGVDRAIPSQDLYRELEVDAGASTEAIEAAYRSLMKRHHPDRAGPDGLARSKRLNLARDWLVDGERRARYDRARSGTHPRRTGASSALGSSVRLGVVGAVALVAAVLVLSWGSSGPGGARPASLGASGDAASTPSTPSSRPTAAPTPQPTATRTPGPTLAPTRAPTPAPTPAATPVATGRADIRFSGMYAEHYAQPLGGASGCSTTTGPGRSLPTLTGFDIGSAAGSPSKWQLTLDDLTVSWSMGIFFEDTADGLWWNSGIGMGSVTRTADGFTFDVVMTDSVHSLRARGTVVCR
jgi:hypothetical protein